jgi:hypothetical protein
MKASEIKTKLTWADLGAWIDVNEPNLAPSGISIQDVRERMERVMDWREDAEFMMRTPSALLGGETPWDVLYYTPGGGHRLMNVLDLVEQKRLAEFPVPSTEVQVERRFG